ncbi:MAG: zf-HC2 domain-containing protein [Acidobacteria bacterium]|nr:zf-HC2 domain-containing protein [Acidobacteriota bacterium]
MYDCHGTEQLLEAYVDNELDAVVTQAISEHLEVCAACNRKMEDIRAQNELLARAVKSAHADNSTLRASIEAATIAKHQQLFQWSMPRVQIWATVAAFTILIAFISIFYLPRFLRPYTSSLFKAAADNHITCIRETEAPDWARTQPEIIQVEESFIGRDRQVPMMTVDGYQLVRARVCMLNGEKFLHLVYENAGGREASLFVGPNKEVIFGDRDLALDGKIIQMAHVSNLNVVSTQVGNHLVIVAAQEETLANTLLLNAASRLSA